MEEISEMQLNFSKTLAECTRLETVLSHSQKEVQNLQEELSSTKRELHGTKKDLERTKIDMNEEAAKNIQKIAQIEDDCVKHEQELKETKQKLVETEELLQHKQELMNDEVVILNGKINDLENELSTVVVERDQLKKSTLVLKQDLEELQKQIQGLCHENDKSEDARKAKEKELELTAFEKNQVENELRELRRQCEDDIRKLQNELECSNTERTSLESKLVETNQRLELAVDETVRLNDESLAKTQQVKQYKKQVDNFRAQLQESSAKIEGYKRDLDYCQRDLQSRDEEQESKVRETNPVTSSSLLQYYDLQVAFVVAQHESEMSTLTSELGRLRREKADLEEKIRQMQMGVIPPETAHLVDQLEREKTELEHKYTQLRDRFNVSSVLLLQSYKTLGLGCLCRVSLNVMINCQRL